ncbi:MAG: conjugal transfer protein TraX [Ruminococcus sp.]|nr:conjugal transfer protein TraX [Ruminococcus sp.]
MKIQLTGNSLKVIAMVTMFIDHFGILIFPDVTLFRIVGRVSFPIYAYLIAEGCKYTKNRVKYFLQVFILGLICSVVFMVMERYIFFCILITFSISILMIYLLDYVKKSLKSRWILLTLALAGTFFLCKYVEVDYGFFGALVPIITYLTDRKPYKFLLFTLSLIVLILAVDNSIQIYCLLSLPFILLYNGKRGKYNLKKFFYLFYPSHFVVIYALSIILAML